MPFDAAVVAAYHAVSGISAVLVPVIGGSGTAIAIIAFTALVRICLHPLNRAQVRAEKARTVLAPHVLGLKTKHKGDPARLNRETMELYKKNGISPFAGLLPVFVQIPVFTVVYRIFVSSAIGGHHNALLTRNLFGTALGSHLGTGPLTIGHVAVFAALLAAVLAIATWSSFRMRSAVAAQPNGTGRLLRLLPYGSVLTAAVVPLAAGLYLATTTLWTVVERRHLTRDRPLTA